MKKGWSEVALGDVLTPVARFESRDELKTYQFAGTYSYARGIFRNELKSGSSFSLPAIQRIETGDFIYCKIMAWEGAFGLADEDVHNCWMSGAFVAFRPELNSIHPKFLHYWFKSETNWRRVAQSSTGTNVRRKSLHPDDFCKATIPLPPLAEQKRLVAKLDAIESGLTRVQKLREETITEAQAFTISLHHHLSKDRVRSLELMLQLDEERETVKVDGRYPQVGIRSFGEGMFRKPPTLGSETTYRAFNVLRDGKLAMSQVKGWEGAVAVCPADLDGWFVSPEYRTFSCRDGECDPNYLAHLVKTRWFHQRLASATRGVGARRERIRPEMLLGIEIPFPDLAEQKAALKSVEHLTRARALTEQLIPNAEALLPSLLDRIVNS